MPRTIPSVVASALLACSVLSGCATAPDPDEFAAQSWVGRSVTDTAGAWPAPSKARRHLDGSASYTWGTSGHCADMGYRAIGSAIYPVTGCATGCTWTAEARPDGIITGVRIATRDRAIGCRLPAASSAAAARSPVGRFHTDAVSIRDRDAVLAQCSSAGAFSFDLPGATPGLWPAVGPCCVTPGAAVCALLPRLSLAP